MSSLAKRLRDTGEGDIYLAPRSTKKLIDDAADRIEALEKALRTIVDGPRDANKSYAELFVEVCIDARAALEGKND